MNASQITIPSRNAYGYGLSVSRTVRPVPPFRADTEAEKLSTEILKITGSPAAEVAWLVYR